MLVLRDAHGRLLLERRPPTGVWAGLWSLPEAPDDDGAYSHAARYGGRVRKDAEFEALPAFLHTFSHYRLEVTPLALSIASGQQVSEDSGRRWLHPEEAARLGLPAPVRKLIASLDTTAGTF
jgi:A/G-specific adenine glycosylase